MVWLKGSAKEVEGRCIKISGTSHYAQIPLCDVAMALLPLLSDLGAVHSHSWVSLAVQETAGN